MSNKKFTDLPELDALADADLFAVTDSDATTSKHIVASNVTNFILSDVNVASKAATIVDKINLINPTLGNNLSAQRLWITDAYQPGEYFLNYSNLTNKPTIPTNTSTFGTVDGFTNDGNLVSHDITANPPKMVVSGTGSTTQVMTSDYVNEGAVNLFYQDQRVDDRQALNFGNLFNTYSSTFDGGEVRDSLQDVLGTFQNIADNQSNVLRISDKDVEANFSPGQLIRIYGASANTANDITTSPGLTLTVSNGGGFTASTGTNSKLFEYRVALFNLQTGEVGPPSNTSSVTVYNEGNDVLGEFNTNNFISLALTGQSGSQGILVYRQVAGAGGFKLLAVLGSKDLLVAWKDYHTFDYTSWSGKNSTDNTYISTTHFPVTVHTGALRGWTDVTISSISSQATSFDLNFDTAYVYVDTSGGAQVAHNDTNTINEAIVTKATQGRKSVELNAKTYNVSHIGVPSNFGLIGTANITQIKKLPWASYAVNEPDNSIIRSTVTSNATAISLVGIDMDGNIKSQFLHNDAEDVTINYALDFGLNPSSILLDMCRVKNIIGGGVYASSPVEFKLTTSEVVNSGVTDRWSFSPLIVDNGTSTLITGNRFQNFTDSVDASVTAQGVIANNVVKACGAGIFTYGSSFLVSSPNVLIGAANEYLSSPDILNSEYDSININLGIAESTAPYGSSAHVYQENGAAFNLAQTSIEAQPATIEYRVKLIRKLSNGDEEVYGNLVGAGAKGIDGVNWSTIANDGFIQGKRYRIIAPGDTNWTAIGSSNANVGTSFVKNSVAVTGTTGTATPDEFVGYSANKPIYIKDIDSGMNRALGQFKFEINDTEGSTASWTNLTSGIYSKGQLATLYAGQITAGNHPAGSAHVGVAWTANYRGYANAGSIIASGSWNVTDTTNPTYTVTVTPSSLNVPLAIGHVIRIDGHGTFALGSAINYGQIANIADSGDNKILEIKYWKGGSGNTGAGVVAGNASGTPASYGTINIIDDFVMAQGLIK